MQKITYYNATKTREVLVSVNIIPVYYLAKKPNRNVLATSYNQDLAKPSVVRPETMRERRLLSNPSLTFDCLTSLGLLTIGVQLKAALIMLRVSVALLRVGRQLYYWSTTLLRQEKKPTVPHNETRLGHITSVLSQLESNLNQMDFAVRDYDSNTLAR